MLPSPCRKSGIHAAPMRALAHRLPWVIMAPFGTPVVPEVYCRHARSSRLGRGWLAARAGEFSSRPNGIVPGAAPVSLARDSRAFATGRRSSIRVVSGIAVVTSTETTSRMPSSAGSDWTSGATLLHAMTVRAPWSRNCTSSSSRV